MQGRCPYCYRVVLFDDDRRVSSHLAPVCRGWDDLMRSMRARELGPEVLSYDDGNPQETPPNG